MPASPGKPQAAFPPWPSAVPRPMSPGKSYGCRCSHRRPLSQSLRQALHHHSPARAPRPQRRIDAIVDGGPCAVGVESTIVDLTEARPRLLRPGGVTPEELRAVLGGLVIDRAVTAPIRGDAVVKGTGDEIPPLCSTGAGGHCLRFPGEGRFLYPAPISPPVTGCSASKRSCPFTSAAPLWPMAGKQTRASLSAGLFAALRILDDPSIGQVFARCPEGGGVAYAVQNRLKKGRGLPCHRCGGGGMILGITGGLRLWEDHGPESRAGPGRSGSGLRRHLP